MCRIDEQLRFLQQLHGAVGVRRFASADKLLGLEQILGKFSAGVLVPEKLRVIEALGELSDDLIAKVTGTESVLTSGV